MFWGFFWRVHCGCYKQLQPCITALAAAQAYLEDLADVSVVPLLLFFLLQFYPALDITAAAEYNITKVLQKYNIILQKQSCKCE